MPHLGCPNDCVFCNQRRISGAQRACHGSQTVKNAIEVSGRLAPQRGRSGNWRFMGAASPAIPEALPAARRCWARRSRILTDGDDKIAIRLSTRPDAIDGAVLAAAEEIRRAAVIELGAQSMCDRVLELSGRGHDSAAVADSSKLIKAAGFDLILQMMTGLPGDTDESCIETAKKIIALAPNGVRIYPTVIVRDTVLCDMWRARNI